MAALCDAALTPREGPGPRAQIALTICERCDRGWQDAAGQVVEVGPAAVARVRCDAQEIGRVDGDAPARAVDAVPAAVRRQIERRDHGRCAVPGCRSSQYVDVHHIVPRAHGGGHAPSNLCLLCTAHHRAVHDGRLRISGEAPALTFRFRHDDGRPYGSPLPETVDHDDDATLALRTLGFSANEATAAVEQARARVGAEAPLEDWIRAALRFCRRPEP